MNAALAPEPHLPLPDWRRTACALMLISMPLLAYGPEGAAGLVGLAWLAFSMLVWGCLLYTSDAADDLTRVGLGGPRLISISTLLQRAQ